MPDIIELIKVIATAEIKSIKKTSDYSFNGLKPLYKSSRQKYIRLYNDFDKEIKKEFRNGFNKETFQTYLNTIDLEIKKLQNTWDTHRGPFVYSDFKGDITETGRISNDHIEKIMFCKQFILKKMRGELYYLTSFYDSRLRNDFDNDLPSAMNLPPNGKALFSMSKIETLMFFYLLEKSEIIKFDENDRNKFIEYNFQYTDVRNNGKGDGPQPLTDTDRHFSIFKSHSALKENDKIKKKLIEKIDKMKDLKL
jgi:hypothetical protein